MISSRSQKGYSIVAVVLGLALIGLVGVELLLRSKRSQAAPQNQVYREQATFTSVAAAEYAMRKFYEGRSPLTEEFPFGPGAFRVVAAGREFQVMSRAGDQQVVHPLVTPRQAECLDVSTGDSRTSGQGREISKLWFTKRCGESVVLDRLTLIWSPDEGEGFDQVLFGRGSGQVLFEGPPKISSGRAAELIDFTLMDHDRYELQKIRFTEGMDARKKIFQLVLLLGDGSEKRIQFTLPTCTDSTC